MPKIIHAISGPRNIVLLLCTVLPKETIVQFLMSRSTGFISKILVFTIPEKRLFKKMANFNRRSKEEGSFIGSGGEIYLKNMAHHQENQSLDWVKPTAYIFWIRHPRKVIHSFTKVIDAVSAKDVGLIQQWSNGNNWRFEGPKLLGFG